MKTGRSNPWLSRLGRLPFLILGIVSLLCGIWGGLARLPLSLPLPADNANWISFHGPLMVCGFLGTVIGLERAVGLRQMWTYLAPLLSGAGAVAFISGQLGRPPEILLAAGSGVFVVVSLRVVQLHRAPHTILMSLAALAWFVGNSLWLFDWPIYRLVPWYITFLAFTIVGERLDLSRFQRPVRWAQPVLIAVLTGYFVGVSLSAWKPEVGLRLMGAGLVLMALWLGRFDIVRRTVNQPGLPRFMGISLLAGYVWLAVSGLLFLIAAPQEYGLIYDAALHGFFLGFVFSMIFSHAPMIFPAVLGLPVGRIPNRFYGHVVLLHLSLLLRLGGDVAGWDQGRRWGAILNAITVVVFLINTVTWMIGKGKKS